MYGNNRFEYAHHNAMDFGSYGMGASTNPGAILPSANMGINWGLQNLELSIGPPSHERPGSTGSTSKMEREELARLAKMNRVNLSVHAPAMTCVAGGQGGEMNEFGRIRAVQEMKESVTFADELGSKMNVKHIPVVVHSVAGVPGNPMPREMMYVADPESGRIIPIEKKEVYYPVEHLTEKYGLKQGRNADFEVTKSGSVILYPEARIKMFNKDQTIGMRQEMVNLKHQEKLYSQYASETGTKLAAERSKGASKEELRAISDEHLNYQNLLGDIQQMQKQKEVERKHLEKKYEGRYFRPTDEVAKEKALKSFVELGYEAYNKPSKPMIVVEQFTPDHALGDPRKTAELVRDARTQLAERLSKEKGMSMDKAMKEASGVLGMTFDTGHANLWKRYGKSDKEIMKWVDEISPVVKHVHLTDNFGDFDAHLPVGWGNAPIKEAVQKLKEKGFTGRTILETFGAPHYGGQGFGIGQSLYAFGEPILPSGQTWENAGRSYFESGYAFTTGPILPDVNFQSYGVGFSGLPYATGGQIGGGKPGGGFSGTPMS